MSYEAEIALPSSPIVRKDHSSVSLDRRAAEAFLRTLYGDELPQTSQIVLSTATHNCCWVGNVESAASVATGDGYSYFNVCLQNWDVAKLAPRADGRPRAQSNTRGTIGSVAAMPGLFADVDVGEKRNEKIYAPDVEAALAALDELPLRPTLVVHSGSGLHAYWLFRELLVFSSDTEREHAAHVLRGWQDCARNHFEKRGWALDSTGDLARELRIPGTIHSKHGRLVTVIREPGDRYDLLDFEEWIPTRDEVGSDGEGAPTSLTPAEVIRIKDALRFVDPRPRENWFRAGAALKWTAGGEQAFEIWDAWSRGCPEKHDPSNQRRTWDSLSVSRTNEITLGTLFFLAQEGGWIDGSAETDRRILLIQPHVDPFEVDLFKEGEELRFTHWGNARRLVRWFGADMLHCAELGGWLAFDGARWCKDEEFVTARGKEVGRRLAGFRKRLGQAMARVRRRQKELQPDPGLVIAPPKSERPEGQDLERREIDSNAKLLELEEDLYRSAAHQAGSASQIRNMIALATSEPGISRKPAEFDADPHLFNTAGGTLDLRTISLRPHQQTDLITLLSPVAYAEGAECPCWNGFIAEVLAHPDGRPDPELVAFVQRLCGYALLGDNREQILGLLVGTGANGKSTLLNVLRELFGDYGKSTSFDLFLDGQHDSSKEFKLATLRGARLVTAQEPSPTRHLDEAMIKAITGGEPVVACFKHRDHFEYTPQFLPLLACNTKPHIRGQDHGTWRRVLLVPFERQWKKAGELGDGPTADPSLQEKLIAELPGILGWALVGLREYQLRGLNPPRRVADAVREFREECDPLSAWWSEQVREVPSASTSVSRLYTNYRDYVGTDGQTMSISQFGRLLAARGFGAKKAAKGTRVVLGITLAQLSEETSR